MLLSEEQWRQLILRSRFVVIDPDKEPDLSSMYNHSGLSRDEIDIELMDHEDSAGFRDSGETSENRSDQIPDSVYGITVQQMDG